jgi:hypothetical protein
LPLQNSLSSHIYTVLDIETSGNTWGNFQWLPINQHFVALSYFLILLHILFFNIIIECKCIILKTCFITCLLQYSDSYMAAVSSTSNSNLMNIGPSGVRALPLAAGINVGGHYKWHFFLLSPGSLLILPEGVVVGFCNFAWAPK